jgi:protoheme ferro-lyase
VNRKYVQNQLEKFWQGINPSDQWVEPGTEEVAKGANELCKDCLTTLERRLMGMDSW